MLVVFLWVGEEVCAALPAPCDPEVCGSSMGKVFLQGGPALPHCWLKAEGFALCLGWLLGLLPGASARCYRALTATDGLSPTPLLQD